MQSTQNPPGLGYGFCQLIWHGQNRLTPTSLFSPSRDSGLDDLVAPFKWQDMGQLACDLSHGRAPAGRVT
jgi:hypothetical protein